MEDYVHERHAGRPHVPHDSTGDDSYEPGMKVPNSVLNECSDSFIAADEKCEKASTQFFADTGLMALLCQHDCPLWLVNMTSAGEKQHYALALLDRLVKNLPPNITIGNLYDIACQLHRSCMKWGSWTRQWTASGLRYPFFTLMVISGHVK